MFGSFKKTVSVTFVDESTREAFASSEVPLESLPDTFAINTELDMAGGHYVVVRAEPQTKDGFARTKRLELTLRKVELIDPKKILFSLPSICGDALPPTVSGGSGGRVRVLHEDDWRQCELISVKHASDISAELAAVRHILANASAAVGWREIHVRNRITAPLPTGIRWNEVVKELGPIQPLDGIAFGAADNRVSCAVAAALGDEVAVWGVEAAGQLQVLCVEGVAAASPATIAALKRVADRFSLVLVHWCRCLAYAPGDSGVEHALGHPWDVVR